MINNDVHPKKIKRKQFDGYILACSVKTKIIQEGCGAMKNFRV